MNSKLIIVSIPNFNNKGITKHFIIRTNDTEDITLVGDFSIKGSIIGVQNSYDSANQIIENLTI